MLEFYGSQRQRLHRGELDRGRDQRGRDAGEAKIRPLGRSLLARC